MKSLKEFKYIWIIPNGDIKKSKHSHFFGEITIKAIPPIYILHDSIYIYTPQQYIYTLHYSIYIHDTTVYIYTTRQYIYTLHNSIYINDTTVYIYTKQQYIYTLHDSIYIHYTTCHMSLVPDHVSCFIWQVSNIFLFTKFIANWWRVFN